MERERVGDVLLEHASAWPRLRALFFTEFTVGDSEPSWIGQTDVAPLIHALPALEEFTATGTVVDLRDEPGEEDEQDEWDARYPALVE